MKHAKHTPGTCSLCLKLIYDHFGECICNECIDKFPPKYRAAPEMLEALQFILEDDRLMNAMDREQARAIIDSVTKATGSAT
jgi:hypothetical protein